MRIAECGVRNAELAIEHRAPSAEGESETRGKAECLGLHKTGICRTPHRDMRSGTVEDRISGLRWFTKREP